MSSKRHSTAPPPPKPPTQFSSTSSLIIADAASLIGTHLISLSSNTIIHPRTKLISTYAPITVGSNCILSERATIGLQSEPSEGLSQGVVIADYVVVEVGARVEAKSVGEGCIIEVNSKIGKGAVLGKHCKIGPMCVVAENEELADYTVVYGNGMQRVDRSGVEHLKFKMIARQVDVLRKLIPGNLPKFINRT
ncbi:hypothetical protein HYALB_00007190 [Hymenoscyphus albidus]|uniref:Dynactin subunit 6 n=1 Tax=Hymenoscyphus albidus TaxID=595503 RepID=A0A9N9PZQ6_9HELO|nr:hypothetical protein HYALB_00007190 [Hymenoscyphus albidus]